MAEASGNPTGSGGVRAIPTEYAGVTFRSRLEATWAYNLDAWGIRWSYEPEGVILPSGAWYLPDFWLPEIRTWLEVKGPGVGGLEKTEEFRKSKIHAPECLRHSTILLDNASAPCSVCGPRDQCRYWKNHPFECCGSFNPYEMVLVGSAPVNGFMALNAYSLNYCKEVCGRFQFISSEAYQGGCRKCGFPNRPREISFFEPTVDHEYWQERRTSWQQMQWMPNGARR